MENCIAFLTQLQQNNNREWFEANKSWYREVQQEFNQFIEQLIDRISRFDPSIRGLNVKECIYRIYRDTRFSPNKTPYKSYIGAYLCPHGKKSGYAGYYFHIEPQGIDPQDLLLGNNMLSTGVYRPEPLALKSIREEIYDNGEQFLAALEQAVGFSLNQSERLKRLPSGFPSDTLYAEYIKLKDFYVEKFLDDPFITQADLPERTAELFQSTYTFNQILNRAIAYAFEMK